MSLEAWQRALRRQFGREQGFLLKNAGGHPVFSEFEVTNPQSRNTYRVVMAASGAGFIHAEPAIPFLPLLTLANLAIGIALAWLYAAVRPRLGPGPMTALLIGLVVFLILIASNLSQTAWSKVPDLVKGVSFVIAAVQAFGASLVAGWLYKECERVSPAAGGTAAGIKWAAPVSARPLAN